MAKHRKPVAARLLLLFSLIPAVAAALIPTPLQATASVKGIDPDLLAKASAGDARSQARVGWAYSTGKGVPKNSAQAAVWFRKAAEQGFPEAQFELGTLYVTGQGVAKDYSQAVDWFRKAAEQGNANGQASLGTSYEDGRGVTQDYEQAAAWYRKAAEQGSDVAQTGLGFLYSVGHGVPQDFEQAAIWYRKADEKDNYVAQYLLSSLYLKGQGVKQSYLRAFLLGDDAARNERDLYEDASGEMKDDLSEEILEPDQSDEAFAAIDRSRHQHWLFMLIDGACFAGMVLMFVYGRKLMVRVRGAGAGERNVL